MEKKSNLDILMIMFGFTFFSGSNYRFNYNKW